MNHFIDLFSPETANAFEKSSRDISGFRVTQEKLAEQINPGDKFICYVTRIGRFVGVLEVLSKYFIDDTPIFYKENDPFKVRFRVKPIIWLPLEKSIPIHEDIFWNSLSFTKGLNKNSKSWTWMVVASLRPIKQQDASFLEKTLIEQSERLVAYPFSEEDKKKLNAPKIRVSGKKEVSVSIPDDKETLEIHIKDQRESIQIQALLVEIGEKLKMKIWIPRNDRNNVLTIWKPKEETLLEELPLVFDETTLKTIENIDVLWIRQRSIVRAFEVEDKTSIYSGILRMADLLALQPMLDIKIHIVAPASRRSEVFKQIARPVFTLMEKGPLSDYCSYISYESIRELAKEKNLQHMTDSVLDEYTENLEE